MESLKNIRGKPEYIEGVGNIYPIKIKDYDKFQKYSNLLLISRNNFEENDFPLLLLIYHHIESFGYSSKQQYIDDMCKLFSLVTQKSVTFLMNEDIEFIVNFDEEQKKLYSINLYNYDSVREVIMKQNLIFEPKIFKNKLVQEWAEKGLKAKQRNATKITIEDFISTVKVYSGITYEQIDEQTIYQLYSDFYRICKLESFRQTSLFATVSEKVDIQYFAESLDIYKNPYDDVFVDSDKLNKFK